MKARKVRREKGKRLQKPGWEAGKKHVEKHEGKLSMLHRASTSPGQPPATDRELEGSRMRHRSGVKANNSAFTGRCRLVLAKTML
jgi:hypothetical protein